MKFLDRFFIVIFNLCLFIVAIATPALIITGSPQYYKAQFEKNGIYGGQMKYIGGDSYQRANFTDEQLDAIVEHIVTYIFTDEKDSFALEMDDVTINGTKKDNVQIFGETAVKHMKDVKDLFLFFRILTVMFAVLLVLLTVYFIQRKEEISSILPIPCYFTPSCLRLPPPFAFGRLSALRQTEKR